MATYKDLTRTSLDKLPPYNPEAEQSVLSAVFIQPQCIPDVLNIMDVSDFYRPSHQIIFRACQQLAHTQGTIDLLLLRDALERQHQLDDIGGAAYLAGLCDFVPTAANVCAHARIVREKALVRKVLTASIELATRAYADTQPAPDLLADAQEILTALHRQTHAKADMFWTQSGAGLAEHIRGDALLKFLTQQYGFHMVSVNGAILFVQNHDNLLTETEWVKSTNKTVKDALKAFCREHKRPDVWRVLAEKNKLFTPAMLTGLDTLHGQFARDAADKCCFYFQNGVIEITKTQVRWKDYAEIDGYLWTESLSPHTYSGRYHLDYRGKLRDDLVASTKAKRRHRVLVLRRILDHIWYYDHAAPAPATDADIHRILLDMHTEAQAALDWAERARRPDLMNREGAEVMILADYAALGAPQVCEYQQILEMISAETVEEYTGKRIHVNNLAAFEHAIAHLLHQHNNPANMRAVVLADSNPTLVSNGRRGKGLVLQILKHLRGAGCVVKEDGKAFNNGQFKFQLVRPNTKVVILDDVGEDFDFKWLYAAITDVFVTESKGFKRIAFAFEDIPRFAITTNHPCYDEGVSSSERAILLPVSDHFIKLGRTPFQVFGHALFDDWDQAEWDRCFDYIIGLVQRYLQRPDPSVAPTVDLTIFNANKLLLKVPEPMVTYLDGLKPDTDHAKDDIMADLTALGVKFRTANEFSKFLHTYCRLRGFKLKGYGKDGRYRRDGKEYLCLQPVTLDLPGVAYEKKPTR